MTMIEELQRRVSELQRRVTDWNLDNHENVKALNTTLNDIEGYIGSQKSLLEKQNLKISDLTRQNAALKDIVEKRYPRSTSPLRCLPHPIRNSMPRCPNSTLTGSRARTMNQPSLLGGRLRLKRSLKTQHQCLRTLKNQKILRMMSISD